MIPTLTSMAVANQAIQLLGDNQPLVSAGAPNFDSSPAGIALAQLYSPTVATVMRQFGWDLARNTQPLVLTGNTAPFPWTYEFTYPANCIEVLQVAPTSVSDQNDPLPVNWSIGNDVVSGTQSKVIFANIAAGNLIYNNGPQESVWDALFTEAVVRLLASKLAMAIAGKSDASAALLQSAGQFEQAAEARGDI